MPKPQPPQVTVRMLTGLEEFGERGQIIRVSHQVAHALIIHKLAECVVDDPRPMEAPVSMGEAKQEGLF